MEVVCNTASSTRFSWKKKAESLTGRSVITAVLFVPSSDACFALFFACLARYLSRARTHARSLRAAMDTRKAGARLYVAEMTEELHASGGDVTSATGVRGREREIAWFRLKKQNETS